MRWTDDTQLSTTPITFGLSAPDAVAAVGRANQPSAWISGAAFLEAFLIGFEVECKIVEAIDPEHYNGGFTRRAPSGRSAPPPLPPSS
jgi:hypothetical protein